jgi:hypothetical protein
MPGWFSLAELEEKEIHPEGAIRKAFAASEL